MKIVFEQWKYIFRNIWFVLPFAIVPALFFAISFDYGAIELFLREFFNGSLDLKFMTVFNALSLWRFDSALGAIYSVCAVLSSILFMSLLLSFVEKHMRIGKRTLSGIFPQLRYQLLSVIGIVLLYFALYEVWALLLSAMLYSVAAIRGAIAYFLFVLIIIVFFAVLLYLATVFYLWLPCIQITGMRAYNAFLYSYRLMVGARGRLILSFAITVLPVFAAIWASVFLSALVSTAVSFVLIVFVFLSFCVRMETAYFTLDKIDREDLLKSYKEF